MDINQLLTICVDNNASDLHLSSGLPPILRIDGDLQPMEMPALDDKEALGLIHTVMNDQQIQSFNNDLEVDFAYQLPDSARFRVNAFHHARGPSAAFRTIPDKIVPLDVIGTPDSFLSICNKPHGLVLMTGPTGSGKSTTLATLIDHINQHKSKHILTIEDPIEFLHTSKKSLIHQRELGETTKSFDKALRSALREDPDVILVGEMRDLETVRLALTAAETGHLVFSTLHTNSAAETIDRIINIFPSSEQFLIRSMLSVSLQAVISQTLLKKIDGGRVAAHEIMICTPAIRNLIRENKVPQIYSAIQTGQSLGMHTLDQYVKKLLADEVISSETAEPLMYS